MSFSIKRLYLTAAVALIAYANADCKPASPHARTFTQPDGTEISVRLRGDERGHYYTSDDGYLLVRRGDTFYYGDVDVSGRQVASPYVARPAAKRGAVERAYLANIDMSQAVKRLDHARSTSPRAQAPAKGPGLFPGTAFPHFGSPKVLVVLVEYTDKTFDTPNPTEYFEDLLNKPGFSEYGATGSCYDYFNDNSMGQFKPDFDLYGPITLAHNRAYYGGNDWWGNDENPEEMVIEACQQLDDQIDFSQYDCDGDGYIDNVYVFYAGQGEAGYGGADTVWPHSWEVTAATSTPYYFDGVRLDRYACSNEWEGTMPDGIGTFVHEFSHVLGLPDLYATSYTGAFTPGAYSAMDYGPYNNNGRTPPAYGAFERYALQWMEPTVLEGRNNITLKNVKHNEACIIKTASENEFFLLENRQKNGWDAYIPGHGMLIWHIDYDSSVWNSNTVNNSSSHQYVDIEEADNSQDEFSRDGDPFPGANGITSFTDNTRPSMRTWRGKNLETPITDITETMGVIRFKVCGGLPDVNPVEITAVDDITAISAQLSWTADEHATTYLVSCFTVSYRNDREIRSYVPGWNLKDVGDTTTVVIDGLDPLTEYHAEVFSSNGVDTSEASPMVAFTTSDPTFDLFTPVALEATAVRDHSFIANWESLDDAVDYTINVFTRERGGVATTDVCGFDDGVKNLPKGWASSSKSSYMNEAYSGEAIPALRLSTDQAYVMSPVYDDEVCSVEFWHRGSNASELNSIKVMALVGGTYTEIADVAIVNDAGGAVTTITDIPEGTFAIRIVYNEVEHKGAIAIDDIKVGHGIGTINISFLDNVATGNVLAYTVTETEPETEYYYNIIATDGTLVSKVSNTVKVTTGILGGITAATRASSITVTGTTVTVTTAPYSAVTVHDLQGRLLYSGRTDAAGRLATDLRAKGLYIVTVSNKASKITL